MSKYLAVIFSVAIAGCDGDASTSTLRTSTSTLELAEQEAREFSVLLETLRQAPLAGVAVSFNLEGAANGATVTPQAVTNADGTARSTIQAGFEAKFEIIATADSATLRIGVTVAKSEGAALQVTLTDRTVQTADKTAAVTLIESVPCNTYDPKVASTPVTTVSNAAQTVSVTPTATVVFNGVTPGVNYGVIALMGTTTTPLGSGCIANVIVAAGATGQVSIAIEDYLEPL